MEKAWDIINAEDMKMEYLGYLTIEVRIILKSLFDIYIYGVNVWTELSRSF
jgi:hypothetical protein